MATDPKPIDQKPVDLTPPSSERPIELPPTTADLIRQLKEFRDLTSKEIAEIKGRIEAMSPKEKIAIEAKIEAKAEKGSKNSGNWLYDLFWS